MNINAKLTLRFSAIVASILIIFSVAVYTFSANYRKEEFYTRLEGRAITTAKLLVTVQEVDKNLLKIIDRNSIFALYREKVLVFDKNDKLVYSSLDDLDVDYSPDMLQQIRKEKKVQNSINELEQVGLLYRDNKDEYVIIASAYDRYGRSKLQNLRTVLISGLIVGIFIIVITGLLFAKQVLAPLAKINDQVLNISAGNLNKRIDEGNQKDEIARLAMNFNQMLQRLETAFEVQQSFVSNASHELRTPLAAMQSQLQVTLAKNRTEEEYRQVLQSLLDDTNNFAGLTNGLLTLAQSSVDNQRLRFTELRIDEVLFSAQEELAKSFPHYHFQLDYDSLPENEKALIVRGSEQLLTTAFTNFIDNACKYSSDHTVNISLAFNEKFIEIRFKDNGAGIPPGEEEKIFTPFYRAANVQNTTKGHGIGLSLCQKIVQLHGGSIKLKSSKNKGSLFTVKLPLDNSAF